MTREGWLSAVRIPKRWLVAGVCLLGVGAAVLALGPRSSGWLLVLLCPLSHVLMMGSHAGGHTPGHSRKPEVDP